MNRIFFSAQPIKTLPSQCFIDNFSVLLALSRTSAECKDKTSWLRRKTSIFHLAFDLYINFSSSLSLRPPLQFRSVIDALTATVASPLFFIPFAFLLNFLLSHLNQNSVFSFLPWPGMLIHDSLAWWPRSTVLLQSDGWDSFRSLVEWSQSCLCTLSSAMPEGRIAI